MIKLHHEVDILFLIPAHDYEVIMPERVTFAGWSVLDHDICVLLAPRTVIEVSAIASEFPQHMVSLAMNSSDQCDQSLVTCFTFQRTRRFPGM